MEDSVTSMRSWVELVCCDFSLVFFYLTIYVYLGFSEYFSWLDVCIWVVTPMLIAQVKVHQVL